MENSYYTVEKLDKHHLNSVEMVNILSGPVIYMGIVSSQILHNEKSISTLWHGFSKAITAV